MKKQLTEPKVDKYIIIVGNRKSLLNIQTKK